MELARHRESITDFLLRTCAASAVTITAIDRLHGGAVHENWQLNVEVTGGEYEGEHDLVLRIDANSSIPMAWNRAQEFHISSAVFAAGVKAPEPLWLCADPGVVGRPFYFMRCASGSADPRRLVKKAPEAIRRKTLGDLGEELAKIHAVEPKQRSPGFLSAPTQVACLERVAYHGAYLDQLDRSCPALEWGLRGLERHAAADREVVFCHGDFCTGNYLASENGLIAVLDRELAHLGNPLEDIGYFFSKCWRFGVVELELFVILYGKAVVERAGTDSVSRLCALNRRLAKEIRNGSMDALYAGVLRQCLFERVRAKLRLRNPKYLQGDE